MNDAFKALADPTRRTILQLLKEKSMSAGEVAEHFQISKPSISHHLNILKQAGLVLDERQGQNIIYTLHTTVVADVIGWMFSIAQPDPPAKKSGKPIKDAEESE
ncbi:autorepressor SdpR family transcription factor [Paenibacillus ottowii]|uniref:Winged helix-turn-helix transcriptional regulator n=1 Tax=Paenibacillus ottowii TaxID=2315729 RepID=A0ABY3BCE9_9BACL|nr:autorepressor SdpR family transcription factor [Paenibacillus ottowii]NEU27491.1 winged helix-turn-helix transcriptional regulator [Paenibacillus polymyxa]TQS00808.1 winged helix-turn-helix transcriptional regulator [Paenibacillus ottowii]